MPADLRPALDLLLGSVIVARHRSAARRLLDGQPSGVRLVTLQGEIFYADGPIQAGAGESEGEQTLLGRARQRRTAGAKIKSLAEEITALDGKVSQLQTGLHAQQEESRPAGAASAKAPARPLRRPTGFWTRPRRL